GVSSRGTQTTDTYSLQGLSQALDRVAEECK
ncbi:MAG: invasion associated locus B family protein, partial [Pseudomonadota bacterium]